MAVQDASSYDGQAELVNTSLATKRHKSRKKMSSRRQSFFWLISGSNLRWASFESVLRFERASDIKSPVMLVIERMHYENDRSEAASNLVRSAVPRRRPGALDCVLPEDRLQVRRNVGGFLRYRLSGRTGIAPEGSTQEPGRASAPAR